MRPGQASKPASSATHFERPEIIMVASRPGTWLGHTDPKAVVTIDHSRCLQLRLPKSRGPSANAKSRPTIRRPLSLVSGAHPQVARTSRLAATVADRSSGPWRPRVDPYSLSPKHITDMAHFTCNSILVLFSVFGLSWSANSLRLVLVSAPPSLLWTSPSTEHPPIP